MVLAALVDRRRGTSGPLKVIAPAWDTTGALPPECAAARWNPKGYVNNSWTEIYLTVTALG